eukprot:scaffold51787_cov30-Tisochrysis_lutea.AAC.8
MQTCDGRLGTTRQGNRRPSALWQRQHSKQCDIRFESGARAPPGAREGSRVTTRHMCRTGEGDEAGGEQRECTGTR